MRGIEVADFRKETDVKKQMEIIYQALLDVNSAFQKVQGEENYRNEIRLFAKKMERALPIGFKECNGINGTDKVTDLSDMIIAEKL